MHNLWRMLGALDRSVQRLLLSWALLGFGYFGLQSVLQNLYLLRLGYGPEFIGLLTGSGQLLWAICALPAGAFGRRFGLRAAIRSSFLLSGASNGLMLLVELTPRDWWTPWLFFWWALSWVGASLNSVNNIPYVMAITDEAERNLTFSAQQGLLGLMAFVGSVVAGLMPGVFASMASASDAAAPYRYTLWIAPVAYLLNVIVLWDIKPVATAGRATGADAGDPMPLGLFLFFALTVFLQMAGDGSVRAFFNVYLDRGLGISTTQIGAVMGAAQLIPVAVAFAAPLVLTRLGAGRTYGTATLGIAVSLLLLGAVPSWIAAAVGFMGVMTMFSLVVPARNIFSQQIVPQRWRTTSSALITIGLASGWAVTAAAGGYLIGVVGFSGLFFIGATLTALSAALTLGYVRLRKMERG